MLNCEKAAIQVFAANKRQGGKKMRERNRKVFQKVLSGALAVMVCCTALSGNVLAAEKKTAAGRIPTIQELRDTKSGEYISTVPTPADSPVINPDYDRSYDNYETRSKEGFLHPGILMNREELNIMRDMVWIGAEPWASVFQEMQKSPYASLDYRPDGPFEVIASDREDYSLTRASTAVYELALMWYITGQKEYADKSIGIMMDWADTVKRDTKRDHLRIGTSTHKFCIAAEIFRYTPSSGWTEENTKKLSAYLDLINPAIDKAYQFYNQGGYALMAYLPKQIFQDNREGYADAIERLVYNKNSGWKNGNSVNYSLSAMIFNSGQFIEMGRDQEHAWDNLGFLSMVLKTTWVQGTKVDKKGNIVSFGGTDLYEYDNQKVLKAAAYWQQYCMGQELPYVGNKNAWGEKTEFAALSNQYRGQTLMWCPSLYYHYLYTKGYGEDEKRTIWKPGKDDADQTEDPYVTYGDLYQYVGIGKDLTVPTYVRGTNVDFPDFQDLTFTPLAAIYDEELKGSPKSVSEGAPDNCPDYGRYLADRFTGTGNGERDTSEGSTKDDRRNGGAIREPGKDEEGNEHFVVSDVQNGEWLAYNIDFEADFGEGVDTLLYTYGTRSGKNTGVKVYVGEWKEKPTQADYEEAVANGEAGDVELGHSGDYANYQTFGGKLADPSRLTGKKTVYFYCYGSNNTFAFHGNPIWFKFVDSRAVDENAGNTADSTKDASVSGTSLVIKDQGWACWKNMDFDSGFSNVALDIHTDAKGTLKMYADGPDEENGGRLIQTWELAGGTNGKVQFSQEDQKAVTGEHAVYFVYSGTELTLNSVQFAKAVSSLETFHDHEAGDYTSVLKGDAKKTADNGLLLDGATGAYASYMQIPFLTGAKTLAVCVKSTGENRLNFDLVTTDPEEAGDIGRNGNLAYFDLPDTEKMSDDGFVTMYFDLGKTGRDKLTGGQFVGMGLSGKGTAEVKYFRLNPENSAPGLTLCEQGKSEPEESQIYVAPGEQKSYTVQAEDPDGDQTEVSVYGELSAGITYSAADKVLTISKDAASGKHTVQFLVTDGTVKCIETYVFHVQSNEDVVQKMIDESGLEADLLTYYLYDKTRYDQYTKARDDALKAAGDADKVNALKSVISDCKENGPVYSKVKFEWRLNGNNDKGSIDLYLDTTDKDAAQKIASTGDLNRTNDKVQTTDWIPFTDSEGNAKRITGNHQLSVWLNTGQTRLISFTLANEDGSVEKTIDAVSFSGSGNTNNLCINQLDNQSKDGTFPHEVRGAATWLQYTWPTHEDFSSLVFEGNSKAWPLRGKTGPGFDFELTPGIVDDLETAKGKMDEKELYTDETFQTLESAYKTAKAAVDHYVEQNLTIERADELEQALEAAIAGLVEKSPAVTVMEDEQAQSLIYFDETGNDDAHGSSKSLNPTACQEAGKTISYKLKVDERFVNPKVRVKKFGFRGSRGTSGEELTAVEPELSAKDLQITSRRNEFLVQWTGDTPGNYRAVFEITSDTGSAEQTVEMINRNAVSRPEFAPQYVRMRFAGFRNEEEKKVELYLTGKDGALDEAHKIAELTSTWDMDAKYTLTDWVQIKWPEGYDPSQNQLTVKIMTRNTHIDFLEFGTDSYQKLYQNSYQKYPVAEAGVMRVEAEHYDYSSKTGFDAVDFNGKNGWENGSPGKGTGAVGSESEGITVVDGKAVLNNPVIFKYNDVTLSNTPSAQEELTCIPETQYMMKGDTQTVQAVLKKEAPTQPVSYISSNPSVLTVDASGRTTAQAAGSAEVTALSAGSSSEPVTIYVADNEYLKSIVSDYERYIKDCSAEYTESSFAAMKAAYEAAVQTLGSRDAKTIYDAAAALEEAVAGRISSSQTKAVDVFCDLAENLLEEEYTPETWAKLQEAVAKAQNCTGDTPQDEVNEAVAELRQALSDLAAVQTDEASEEDKVQLQEMLGQAEKLLEDGQQNYTDESWAELTRAIELARTILSENPTTKLRIQIAATGLSQAIDSLDTAPDFIELAKLCGRYMNLDSEAYTEESYQTVKEALEQIQKALEAQEGTQKEIDQLTEALQTAVNNLQLKPVPADKSRLQNKYEEYSRLTQGNYTDDSWKAFRKALDNAKTILEKQDADQASVDAALKLLEDAKSYLTEKKPDSGQDQKPGTSSAVKVKEIRISGISKKIAAGKKITLTASVSPSNASSKALTWSTSNKKYATVDSKGVVKTKKAGIGKTVTITAKAKDGSGKSASYKIKIMKGVVKKIKLSASKTVTAGKKVTVKAKITASKGANKKLAYSVRNKKYATVSSKGVVKAKKAGKGKTITITAKATDGSGKTATLKIKLK